MTPPVIDPVRILEELRASRGGLRSRSVEQRVRGLAWAAAAWRDDPGMIEEISRSTGYSAPVVETGLADLFGSVTESGLEAWWRRDPRRNARRPVDGPVAVVPAGNVPGVGLFPVIGCLLAGVPVLLKSPSAEPATGPAWKRLLDTHAPELGAAVACGAWKGGASAKEDALYSGVARIFVYGHDATVADLRHRYPDRVSGFGTGVSFALVGESEKADDEAAGELARDVAIWDQQGCLSPHVAYVLGDFDRSDRFAARLADALAAIRRRLPRGRLTPGEAAGIRRRRHEAEARAIAGEEIRLRTPAPGGATAAMDWTVITERNAPFRPSPGSRTVRVHPLPRVEDLEVRLAEWRDRLQGAGVGPELPLRETAEALRRAGVTHVVPLGTMQAPVIGWLNKGRDQLDELFTRGSTGGEQ